MKTIDIKINDLTLLERFIAGLGASAMTFRYFKNRPPQVIATHVCTKLLLDDSGNPIGYGHLDPAEGRVWLGVCLVEGAAGKGLGRMIMDALLASAREQKINEIYLAVDNVNVRARALYEKCGFELVEPKETLGIYRLKL